MRLWSVFLFLLVMVGIAIVAGPGFRRLMKKVLGLPDLPHVTRIRPRIAPRITPDTSRRKPPHDR